jgi:hypothetical protein
MRSLTDGKWLRRLFDLRAIIFGFSLLQLIVTQVWVSRWHQNFGTGPIEVYPDKLFIVPVILVITAFLLFVVTWWSQVLAVVASGWVLYLLGYVALRGASLAHDVPLFSLSSLRLWFIEKYVGQPQEFLQLTLASTIILYVIVALSRRWRSARPTIKPANA